MRVTAALLPLLSVLSTLHGLVAANEHTIGKRGAGRRHRGVNALPDFAMHAADFRVRGLSKRFDGARYSNYDITTGEVACGGFYQASDFVVALNSEQFGSGSYCGQSITIAWQGISTQATIVDECPGCPYAGLDLTDGLFDFFAGSLDAGYLYDGTWEVGVPAPPPPTTTPPPPPPTSTPPPPPPPPPTTTTTYTPTTSSTPPPPPPSTSSSKPHTSSLVPPTTSSVYTPPPTISSSIPTTSSVPPTSSSVTPSTSATPTPTPSSAIGQLFLSYVQLAALEVVALGAH